jgi:hypothetical protein
LIVTNVELIVMHKPLYKIHLEQRNLGRGKVGTLFGLVIKPTLAVFQNKYRLNLFILQSVFFIDDD